MADEKTLFDRIDELLGYTNELAEQNLIPDDVVTFDTDSRSLEDDVDSQCWKWRTLTDDKFNNWIETQDDWHEIKDILNTHRDILQELKTYYIDECKEVFAYKEGIKSGKIMASQIHHR